MAHEEGDLNDIRAVLGNDVAMKADREGKPPFPDGTIICHALIKGGDLAFTHYAP